MFWTMQEQKKRHCYNSDIVIGKFIITYLEAEFLDLTGTKVLRGCCYIT
jgi:hypothetical protein